MNKLLSTGIIKTEPRKWTKEEEDTILLMRDNGMSSYQISEAINRSVVSVSVKLKRLTKTNDTYNSRHREDKYLHNGLFMSQLGATSVLDLYAGNTYYKDYNVVTNDKDLSMLCDYNTEAFDLLCELYLKKQKFDVVDLDPYGSAIDEFPIALKLANKGIIITLGEMGHKRFKRLDFVRKWYGIDRLEDFTSERIIESLITVGKRYKKQLIPIFVRDYNRISRVYFEIKKYKETEQWS
jgi:hypothetical protein